MEQQGSSVCGKKAFFLVMIAVGFVTLYFWTWQKTQNHSALGLVIEHRQSLETARHHTNEKIHHDVHNGNMWYTGGNQTFQVQDLTASYPKSADSNGVATDLQHHIKKGLEETVNLFEIELKKIRLLIQNETTRAAGDRLLHDSKLKINTIMDDVNNLTKLYDEVRINNHAKWLSDLVQRRFIHLQNPSDCRNRRKVLCTFNTYGYGCMLHHLSYCMITAYATNRTLVLQSKGWKYAPGGWETFFLPLSQTCTDKSGNQTVQWGFPPHVQHSTAPLDVLQKQLDNAQVVEMPLVGYMRPRGAFLPSNIPEDLAPDLGKFHSLPLVWWIGQVMKYVLRPNPTFANEINAYRKRLGFEHPIVGVQVRRTDKILEAKFYDLVEYMKHVDVYYNKLEKTTKVYKRRVYLATDEVGLLAEAKKQYPNYTFVSDHDMSVKAVPKKRYSVDGLKGILLDMQFLSDCDFLVCTFSSNICRAVYEVMQTKHTDASDLAVSLDSGYFYHGQGEKALTFKEFHKPRVNTFKMPVYPDVPLHVEQNYVP